MRRIVVQLHACPTRLLGPYGCEWIDTPALNRLAAEGVVFDSHYATRPGTDCSVPLSLQYVKWADGFDRDVNRLYMDDLKGQENNLLVIKYFDFTIPGADFPSGPTNLAHDGEREAIFEHSRQLTEEIDLNVQSDFEDMDQAGLDGEALYLFTSASGLPLGEHGVIGADGSRLHEELVHLPLIVRFPDRRWAGYRVAGYTTPDDLAELLTTGSTERLESLILGTRPTRESVESRSENEVSVRTADSCLILPLGGNPNPPLLYDRPDDRFEVNNLAERQSDRLEELKGKIRFTTEDTEDAEKKQNSSS